MNSPLNSYRNQIWISSLILGFGFAVTGAGTVMLGIILPVLSARWGLRDEGGGVLFFLQFLGCTLGAVLTGTSRMRAMRSGYGLMAASACVLAYAGRDAAFFFFFFFGLGLGLAMTATSLVISDRYGDDRARQLERINFAWSAGATAAPIAMIPFLGLASLRSLFLVFLALSLGLLIWSFAFEREPIHSARNGGSAQSGKSNGAQNDPAALKHLLPLLVLAMCSVGVETALSGWLTTYFHRSASASLASAAITTALFWVGIVLSRFAFSTRLLTIIGRRAALQILVWGTATAVVLLIAAQNPATIRAAAGLAGFCVGPLYPLFLSFLLERTDRGWIFAAGGVGSVVFPWLTGLVSSNFGSLRMGMVAPCGAAALMLLLLPFSFRASRMAVPAR